MKGKSLPIGGLFLFTTCNFLKMLIILFFINIIIRYNDIYENDYLNHITWQFLSTMNLKATLYINYKKVCEREMNTKKRNIILSIMVAMFLGAVEGTVVTTAMPTIVKSLNGFDKISLVFSVYLLTSAISTPIYGKIADLYGRKAALLTGISIFLIGSALCGISMNMYELILFRGLQGIGAGAIFTVSYTIVGDVFAVEERGKVQGWISSVWGIASLLGPFLGGFLIDYMSWHWIFYINIPFGIFSIILLQKNLDEKFEKKESAIDYLGIVTLSFSIIIFLCTILAINENTKIYSFKIVTPIICTIVLLIVFYIAEKRAKDPLMPFDIFSTQTNIVNIISLLISAILIGTDVYLPVYIQNVLGFSATISGISLASMSISWILSSWILSKTIQKYGEKIVVFISTFIIFISTVLMYTLNVKSSLVLVVIYAFIIGFGYGGTLTTLTIVIQEAVDYEKRGAATGANSLLRTIGQTVGVAGFGVIFNLNISKYLGKLNIINVNASNLYSSGKLSNNIPIDKVKESLNYGIHSLVLIFVVLSIICVVMSLVMSNSLKASSRNK
ncbi:drug resistance transporter, EmrB/QacA subfamily [Clostridium acidisoli DSM 12555]|uniref:Drug resistance transporter, EmrB/QacA subfamily n=2 Tax=Clostridium TaxID=1485 RepID=A0A1W1XF88_9CLOT|nr:drug resistance transporter, EmrB/QacA subfamily [Clostridium acidisoli DSM 12555]